jgi:hypothetical protein
MMPLASSWHVRRKLAAAMTDPVSLPFEVEPDPITYIEPGGFAKAAGVSPPRFFFSFFPTFDASPLVSAPVYTLTPTYLGLSPLARSTIELIDETHPPLAIFMLERDEDGDFIFGDNTSFVHGVASSSRAAIADWFDAAEELRSSLERRQGALQPTLEFRRQTLDAILGRDAALER